MKLSDSTSKTTSLYRLDNLGLSQKVHESSCGVILLIQGIQDHQS